MNIRIMLKLLHTLEQMRKHEHWTRQQLAGYQAKVLLDMRKYAYERSPFYQTFHKGLMDRPLYELPVLTKSMMMENFDALVTDRTLHLEDIRLFAEQGEAGQRFKDHYYKNSPVRQQWTSGVFPVR
jgi:Coenzyme F390 synthetase